MAEVDSMEFYERVMDDESETRTKTIEHSSGAEIDVRLTDIDRKKLFDEINRLPDAMLQTLSEADDEEEAQDMAEERGMLSNVDGDTIMAFENICAESLEDPNGKLTPHHFQDMVQQLSFEVLFEMGAEVIEISVEESGSIEDFRDPD